MNEYKVPGIWKWTVILLIACNIGLMLTIWLKPQMEGDNNGHPERPRNYVIRSLKFTDEQVDKYDLLIHDHRSAMNRLSREAMELRQALFNNIKSGAAGLNIDSLAQIIGNKQKEIEVVTYHHFEQVRATVCTEAQKPEFDKIIMDVIKKMNGGIRGGPPPHEREGHEPPPGERDEDEHGPNDGQGSPRP